MMRAVAAIAVLLVVVMAVSVHAASQPKLVQPIEGAVLGPHGLSGPLSVFAQEVQAHTIAAHFCSLLPSGHRLLALAREAQANGEPLVAGQAYVRATHYLAELGEGDHEPMSRDALACLARDERLGGVGYADYCHKDLA